MMFIRPTLCIFIWSQWYLVYGDHTMWVFTKVLKLVVITPKMQISRDRIDEPNIGRGSIVNCNRCLGQRKVHVKILQVWTDPLNPDEHTRTYIFLNSVRSYWKLQVGNDLQNTKCKCIRVPSQKDLTVHYPKMWLSGQQKVWNIDSLWQYMYCQGSL